MVHSDNEVSVLRNGGSGAPGITLGSNGGAGGGTGGLGGSGESSEDEREGRIRVGRDYQAVPPPFIPSSDRRPEQCAERALLVWSPANHIAGQKLDEFIQVAKEKYGYNSEQALGMLFWHKHDLDRALQDLANFTPFPDEWSVEDKVLFEQAFQFHGKSFHRIRQMLPDKSIAALVKYYYSWKKTRTRTSLMDRQARRLGQQREDGSGYGSEAFGDGASDEETRAEGSLESKRCGNCGILANTLHSTEKGKEGGVVKEKGDKNGANSKEKNGVSGTLQCSTCHAFWARTGQMRPTTGPTRKDGVKQKHSVFRNSSQPPKGMYINHDDLVTLATGPSGQGEAILQGLDREIVGHKRIVQNNKQLLSSLRRKARDRDLAPYRVLPDPASRINARWTNEELLLAVQGIRKFGKNFSVIASILGTKTESHVRSFFVNYRRRYDLDVIYKEYEAEFGPSDQSEGGDKDEAEQVLLEGGKETASPKTNQPSSPARSRSPAASHNKINANGK